MTRRSRPLDRRRHGARVRLHQRLPRHGERRRDVDLHARHGPADRGRDGGHAELRRRLPVARGGRHGGQRDRRRRPHHARDRVRGARRRDRVEPRHVVVRAAVVVLARAHRRRRGRRVRGGRAQRGVRGGPPRQGRPARARGPRARAVRGGHGDRHRLPDRRPPGARSRRARVPARSARLRRAVLALARHERRAEDDGHHRARARRRRAPGRRRRRAHVGRPVGRERDRPRHLLRRLADHPHDGLADHQDGSRPGLRRPGRGRDDHLRGDATPGSRSRRRT